MHTHNPAAAPPAAATTTDAATAPEPTIRAAALNAPTASASSTEADASASAAAATAKADTTAADAAPTIRATALDVPTAATATAKADTTAVTAATDATTSAVTAQPTAPAPATDPSPPPRRSRLPLANLTASRPSRPARTIAALSAAWLLATTAHAAHLDLATLLLITLATAALTRYGSTLLDRLLAALTLLAGAAIVGGLVISYWPWGLHPVAVGGAALSTLILVSAATRRPFRLPLRFAAADGIAVLAGGAAVVIAAWPTLHASFWKRFDYSALLGDRLRQFAMFDAVRSGHSYAFAHFDRVSAQAIPGTRTYPSGMQMVYAIVDCFVHGDAAPGAPLDEFQRYYWYTLISFGLLVLTTAWATRRMIGPMATDRLRLPSVFVAAGVGAFLATGYFLSYVWQGFDSVVFASIFLVGGMAVILRPPRNVWEQALLAGAAFLAVVFGHPLLLPHITFVLAAALLTSRKKIIKRRGSKPLRPAIAAAGIAVLVSAPLFAVAGLSIGTRFHTDGFIIALPWHVVLTTAAAAAIALANPATRRLPHAKAALTALAATGAVQIALEFYLAHHASTRYYIEKSLNGFVLMCLVALGGLANLWPATRSRRPARRRVWMWPVRQAETAIAAVTAALAAGAVAFAPAYINWPRFQPGTDSTWAQLWTSGRTFIADYGHQLSAQDRAGVYTDGKPTIIASSPYGVLNLNMSLLAGIANRNLHSVSGQINNTTYLYGLTNLPAKGEWPPQSKASLRILEHIITSNPVPLRIVVSDKVLAAKLQDFAAHYPRTHVQILYVH